MNITGGPDLSLAEAAEATALITKVADPEANVIYGIVTDESMGDAVKVTVIATGFQRGGPSARCRPRRWTSATTWARGAAAASLSPAESGGFYRKTPNAKAAVGRRPHGPRRARVPAQAGQRRRRVSPACHRGKLLWIDLEMTGLDVEKEVVIEAAAIVTDVELRELDTYETVVRQPQAVPGRDGRLEHQSTTASSGLTAKVPTGREPNLVEDDLIRLVATHFDGARGARRQLDHAGPPLHQPLLHRASRASSTTGCWTSPPGRS